MRVRSLIFFGVFTRGSVSAESEFSRFEGRRLWVLSFFGIVTAVPFESVGARFGKWTAMFAEREIGAAELHFNGLVLRARGGSLGTLGLEFPDQKALDRDFFAFFNYFL